MSEQAIWSAIDDDEPREWDVFVNGSWWTRGMATSVEVIIEHVSQWLRDAYAFESRAGETVDTHVQVRCKATDERACQRISVDV